MKNNKWQVCICGAIKCENEYLMVKRSLDDEDCAGFWEMPSGKLDFGETVEQGLQREIFEEVGIDITPFDKKIVGISEYSSDKPEGTKYSVQLNYVIDVPTKDLPIKLSSEHTAFVWATRDSEYVDEFIAEIIDTIEPRNEVGYARTKKM